MSFDAIPEDKAQSFPCEVCNGNIKLSVTSGLWECDECGCLPGSKPVTKAEHEEAAGMGLEDVFMSHHTQPCDCAVCDDIALRKSLKWPATKEFCCDDAMNMKAELEACKHLLQKHGIHMVSKHCWCNPTVENDCCAAPDMATIQKATITFTDGADYNLNISIEFDPEITDDTSSNAVNYALKCMEYITECGDVR